MNDVKKTTLIRILSAAIGLPIYAFTIATDMLQCTGVLINSMIVSLVSLHEFYRISDRGVSGGPFVKMGLVFGTLINIIMYIYAFGGVYGYGSLVKSYDARIILFILPLAATTAFIMQIFKRPLSGAAYSIGTTIMGLVIIVLPFSHIILMRSLSNGVYYIVMLNIVVMLNDTFAYFGGVMFGRHKTGLAVSPNKSWEGYFSGLLGGVLAMIITNQIYISFFGRHLFHFIEAAILGIVFSVLGSLGDLAESAVKRDGNVKDSGKIMPGHGGMWDTFDALIFTMPLFYYYLAFKGVP